MLRRRFNDTLALVVVVAIFVVVGLDSFLNGGIRAEFVTALILILQQVVFYYFRKKETTP